MEKVQRLKLKMKFYKINGNDETCLIKEEKINILTVESSHINKNVINLTFYFKGHATGK